MEKRVAGIIRWLERCVKAYKSGSVERALMEAECARADMETLRGDLWEKLDGSFCLRRVNRFKILEAVLCALGIMLAGATPLALQPAGPAVTAPRAEGNFTLEWITPDERQLLSNVRKRPGESSAMAVKPAGLLMRPESVKSEAVPAEAAPVSVLTAEPAMRGKTAPAPPRVAHRKIEQRKPETSLTYDSILSLIETGERAMSNEPPAIKVEIASGK